MSHLAHEMCGVDFFLSYNTTSDRVVGLVEFVKRFFNRNKITFFSAESIRFNENYLQTFQVQSLRSKIFLFFIDKHSLECEWFLYNFIYAQSHNALYHLPILLPIVCDDELECCERRAAQLETLPSSISRCIDANDNETKSHNKSSSSNNNNTIDSSTESTARLKLLDDLLRDCVISIRMSEMNSHDCLLAKLKEMLIDIIPMQLEDIALLEQDQDVEDNGSRRERTRSISSSSSGSGNGSNTSSNTSSSSNSNASNKAIDRVALNRSQHTAVGRPMRSVSAKSTKLQPSGGGGVAKRYADSFRPINRDEEEFLRHMLTNESSLMQRFLISNAESTHWSSQNADEKQQRVLVSLSVPHDAMDKHLVSMLNRQCRLVWIDAIMINKINYFNLLWTMNEPAASTAAAAKTKSASIDLSTSPTGKTTRVAEPPRYLIFYDLNTAQLAHLCKELSGDDSGGDFWQIDLIESYVKAMSSDRDKRREEGSNAATVSLAVGSSSQRIVKSATTRRQQQHDNERQKQQQRQQQQLVATTRSYEDIYFMCQFRRDVISTRNSSSKSVSQSLNRLRHSIIDRRFGECFCQMVSFNYRQNYVPMRCSPLVVRVNTLTNKHVYYSTLFMPVAMHQVKVATGTISLEAASEDYLTHPLYCVRLDLHDTELAQLYSELAPCGWKLIDLKAYKDEKSISKFSVIFSALPDTFYEGSSMLFLGLSRGELLAKVKEMAIKRLYPKLLTNYGYQDRRGEHVYAVFFCQF